MPAEPKPIRLLVVDDSRDLLDVFSLTARREPDIKVVGALESADRVLELLEEPGADVVLIDLTMPGKPPLDAVREMGERFPAVRAVAFSGYDDAETVRLAARAGAQGFASKHLDLAEVLEIVRRVARGETVLGTR
jgi:two-component system NarL family response regulator